MATTQYYSFDENGTVFFFRGESFAYPVGEKQAAEIASALNRVKPNEFFFALEISTPDHILHTLVRIPTTRTGKRLGRQTRDAVQRQLLLALKKPLAEGSVALELPEGSRVLKNNRWCKAGVV
ncbi:MAG: hypothetical protein RL141_739 [Candidatus Parcubacteria bacterium]|jgi:hypothetical protein